jgi:hypothetical protein
MRKGVIEENHLYGGSVQHNSTGRDSDVGMLTPSIRYNEDHWGITNLAAAANSIMWNFGLVWKPTLTCSSSVSTRSMIGRTAQRGGSASRKRRSWPDAALPGPVVL